MARSVLRVPSTRETPQSKGLGASEIFGVRIAESPRGCSLLSAMFHVDSGFTHGPRSEPSDSTTHPYLCLFRHRTSAWNRIDAACGHGHRNVGSEYGTGHCRIQALLRTYERRVNDDHRRRKRHELAAD